MPRCKTHRNRDSLAECSACGASFCEECLVRGKDPPLCLECSIAEAGKLVGREARSHHAHEAAAPWKETERRSWTRLVVVCGLILIAAEAATIFLLRPAGSGTGGVSAGVHDAGKARLVMGTADLLLIRSRLEDQYLRTGVLPESLLALELPPQVKSRIAKGQIRYEEEQGRDFTLLSNDSPVPIRGGAATGTRKQGEGP